MRRFAATIRKTAVQIPTPQIWYDLDDLSTLIMTGTQVDQINSKGTIANMEMIKNIGTNERVDYDGRKVLFINNGSEFRADNSDKADYTFLHDRLLSNSVFVVFNSLGVDIFDYILTTSKLTTLDTGFVIVDESRGSSVKQLRVNIIRSVGGTNSFAYTSPNNTIETNALNLFKSNMDNSVINLQFNNVTNTSTVTPTSDSLSTELLRIARSGLQGHIAEIIIYDRKLTTTEETEVTDYLNNKWSL